MARVETPACVRGDTWVYQTCHVVVRTTQGVFTARDRAPAAGTPSHWERLSDIPPLVEARTRGPSPEEDATKAGHPAFVASSSVYHPQTDGLVERFNKTLKQMLKTAMALDGKNWD